jgi:hypothetical protein
MDGQTLQQLFAGSNPFLAQMGEKAFNLDQQKRQADLATTLGLEQRNQAMHPLQMQNTQAVTRLNNSTAATNEDNLKAQLPAEKRLQLKMSQFFKESDELTQEQTRMQVQRMMQIAQMAKSNGGALPPGIQLSPEEIQQYAPGNLDKLIKYGETFFASDPKEIAARQRAAEALKLEEKRAQGRIDLKSIAPPGGGKNTDPGLAKMNLEQQYGYWNNMAARETDAEKKAQYQAEADRIELMIYRKRSEAEAARKAGNVDPVATANNPGGDVVARPPANPLPTPRNGVVPSSGSPAQSRTVKMKAANGTVYDVPANQVQAAKARGWTE